MMHKYFATQGTKILSTFCLVSRSAESEEWRQGQGGQRRRVLTVLGPAEKGGTEDPGGEPCWGVGVELLGWEVVGGVEGCRVAVGGRVWRGPGMMNHQVARVCCYGDAVGEQTVHWQTHVLSVVLHARKHAKSHTALPPGGGFAGSRGGLQAGPGSPSEEAP